MFEVIVKNEKGEVEKQFKIGDDFTIIFNLPESNNKKGVYCTQLHANEESAIMMLGSMFKAISGTMKYPPEALLALLAKINDIESTEINELDLGKPLDEILSRLKPKTKVQVMGLGTMDADEKELAEAITEFVEGALEQGMEMDEIAKILSNGPMKGDLN